MLDQNEIQAAERQREEEAISAKVRVEELAEIIAGEESQPQCAEQAEERNDLRPLIKRPGLRAKIELLALRIGNCKIVECPNS